MRKEINGVTNYIYIGRFVTNVLLCRATASSVIERRMNIRDDDDVVTDGETEEHSRSRYCKCKFYLILLVARAPLLFMILVT